MIVFAIAELQSEAVIESESQVENNVDKQGYEGCQSYDQIGSFWNIAFIGLECEGAHLN